MSANDNAMTRFLFAILQQKCLKDIDWNKVAHDPILAQEITNGHAARMRYSRFRAAMLGIEPQRRNRTNPNRTRVSKKKKDDSAKTKKDDEAASPASGSGIKSENTGPVKHERDNLDRAETPATASSILPSPKIKQERMFIPTTTAPTATASPRSLHHHHPHHHTTLASLAGPSLSDMHFRHNMRLLTPCSDSDVLTAASQGFGHSGSPATSDLDILHSDVTASFDFCREPSRTAAAGGHHHTTTDPVSSAAWNHHHQHHVNGGYGGFGLDMVGYGADDCYSTFCEQPDDEHGGHGGHGGHNIHAGHGAHGHAGHPGHGHSSLIVPDELGVHAMLEEGGHTVVKHEEWDGQAFH